MKKNNKYIVKDITKNKDLVTSNVKPDLYSSYFKVEKNGKSQYYSYTTGRVFYEE